MKCPSCGASMKSATENYKYNESGLPNVVLVGIEVRRCAKCGDFEVGIPRIEQLHRTIAFALISKMHRLTSDEVRFLRSYLGWSGKDFAKHMGVRAESVSRWETGREPIGPQADRLLRLFVATRTPEQRYEADQLAELLDEAKPTKIRLQRRGSEWKVAA